MSIDWTTMRADPASAAALAALEATAGSFDTAVPLVLLPVRLETRFATVEVPDTTSLAGELTKALGALTVTLSGIAQGSYATRLSGTVAQKKQQKVEVEQPLYASVEAALSVAADQLTALHTLLQQPVTTATKAEQSSLVAGCAALEEVFAAAAAALATLRSPYQRDLFLGRLKDTDTQTSAAIDVVRGRVLPALRLIDELRVRPAARVAADLGRDPTGRALRVELDRPAASLVPTPRVVRADGTAAAALGAQRTIALDHSRLSDTAAAAAQIAVALAAPEGDVAALLPAAAALSVLPGAAKADLLAAVDVASRLRPGASGLVELRARIAAVPSDRADLDASVPDHLRGTVFTVPPAVRVENRLHVRIYPEALAVDTHEEQLTETEATAGAAFWTQTAAAGTDERLRLGAWRALCAARSTRRAAWVARSTEPVAPAPTPGAVAGTAIQRDLDVLVKRLGSLSRRRTPDDPRAPGQPTQPDPRTGAAISKAFASLQDRIGSAPPIPAAVLASIGSGIATAAGVLDSLDAAGITGVDSWRRQLKDLAAAVDALAVEEPPAPVVSDDVRKPATWTRAASSTVLPDRFAVVAVSGGVVRHVSAGNPVPSDLALGLDPADTAGGFALDADGNLLLAEGIRWLADFDEAVAKGMAVSVPITAAEAAAGFDQVFVIGLCAGTADEGATRLGAMLDNHHYTAEGLALLPVGTPTNNTETAAAGHSSADDADTAYAIERGPSLVGGAREPDGARLARAFGVDPDVLAHVAGADGTDGTDALTTNTALWAGTIGHALDELAAGLMPTSTRERLRTFGVENVTGRGLTSSFRVADQPYGVLPTTAYSRFRPDVLDTPAAAAGDATERATQARFDQALYGFLRQMHADWTRLRIGDGTHRGVRHAHSPEVGRPGFDAQAHFLQMLGLQATSVDSSYRFAVNVADRGGVRGRPDLSLAFGVPKAGGSGGSGGSAADFGPFALMERFADPLRIAYGLPNVPPRAGAGAARDWDPTYRRLTDSRAYELRLLRGLKPMLGAVADAGTGGRLATLLAATAADLADRGRHQIPAGVPLAEMLIRQALLAELRRAAVRILLIERLASEQSLALAGSFEPVPVVDPGRDRRGIHLEPAVRGPRPARLPARCHVVGVRPGAVPRLPQLGRVPRRPRPERPGHGLSRPGRAPARARRAGRPCRRRRRPDRTPGGATHRPRPRTPRPGRPPAGRLADRPGSAPAHEPALGTPPRSAGRRLRMGGEPPPGRCRRTRDERPRRARRPAHRRRPTGQADHRRSEPARRVRPDPVADPRGDRGDPPQRIRVAGRRGRSRERDVGEPVVGASPHRPGAHRRGPGRERPRRVARLPARTVPARVLRAPGHARGRRTGRGDRAAAARVPDGGDGGSVHRRR